MGEDQILKGVNCSLTRFETRLHHHHHHLLCVTLTSYGNVLIPEFPPPCQLEVKDELECKFKRCEMKFLYPLLLLSLCLPSFSFPFPFLC